MGMLFRWKRRNRYTLDELALRRQKRAEVVRSSLPLFATVLLICLVILLSLLCMKPLRELQELDQKHARVEEQLERAKREQERATQEYKWMVKDPEYFEIKARDKNNLSLPEENVIRFIEPDQPLR